MDNKIEVNKDRNDIESTRPLRRYTPRCDIWESADGIRVVAEMPGVDGKSVEVTLERDVLTISGNAPLAGPANHQAVYAEFEGGEYRRSFQVSSSANAEGIQAKYKNGLLEVLVPKRKPAQRRIEVATA